MKLKAFMPPTISAYFCWTYLKSFFALTAIILGIVYLFDMIELLRRAKGYEDVTIMLVAQMGLFKLPDVGQLALPFAVLFSAMFCLWKLTRNSELVIARSAGLSIWQILAPVVLAAMMIGILQVSVINPFGALLVSRYENLENNYLKQKSSLVSFSEQGLWLKQDYNDGHIILHADDIDMTEGVLDTVIVLFFDSENIFYRRIDAKDGALTPGEWMFNDVVSNEPQKLPDSSDFIILATDLTLDDIADSFASPTTIPFWKLPSFINTMEKAGFNAAEAKVHFQSLLAIPFLYIAMILLAACVSLHSPRAGRTFIMVVLGVFIGFVLFFMSSFLQALGVSGQIPIVFAAWAPSAIALLLGGSVMMTLEDG